MDIDTLALRIKALEDKLARYEPMLEEVLPDYVARQKQESAEAAEMKKGLIDALEQAGVTRNYGNARCAPITGNESVEELKSMLEAARLGQQEAADAKALQDAADETLRVENERVAKEVSDKAEADRVEAERVAAEAKAAADAQAAEEARIAEEARLAAEEAEKVKAAAAAEQGASDPDKNPGVVLQPGEPETGEVAHPALQDPVNPTVEKADVVAARDGGREAFITYAMTDAGMSAEEAAWAWDHPPVRSAE